MPSPKPPVTLAIDIGGTGLKAILLDASGKKAADRIRVPTPRPAKPREVIAALREMVAPWVSRFDRVSVGFPGVVIDGVTQTAPNLHASWHGQNLERALEKLWHRPTRVLNDAGVQGFGVIERRGLEMVLTLGTGMGCALFVDGTYVPNLELAHHPLRHGKTYEEYIGVAALEDVGKKKWNHRLARVVRQVLPVFNPRRLYLGGGNAKHVEQKLPPGVTLVSNTAGLLGGIALWEPREGATFPRRKARVTSRSRRRARPTPPSPR